ncbi:MAG: acyl-CoA dehydrogenase [Alphaproteobacteria bacterium]|nr:acyl-CoA dehydrogenase [Alphaproteobacteria bacterium]
MTQALLVGAVMLFLALLYGGRGYWAWVSALALCFGAWVLGGVATPTAFVAAASVAILAALVFGLPAIRRHVVSAPVMRALRAFLPSIGETERIALEAGTVWWDGDLFSGNPNWQKLLDFTPQPLSADEKAFLDGPVEELCTMLDDWQIAQDRDLPQDVWNFLKRERFFGIIIPKEHGGLGFSAIANSAIVTKLSSRSVTAAITVMVPNSLGPGELLVHYGTEEQKNHYLPRLARGEEIPCFALTEPGAGSDAANGKSRGVVGEGMWNGEKIIGIRLTFNKRYITLAPVATVVGLSFRLVDPDHLLGDAEDRGITCALIPRDTPGVEIGRRHDPMGIPFQNGPVTGEDVFVPLDYVIGGLDGIGNGWRMLMESLAAGRSVSLPALSVGAMELAARVTGAYGTVREQFNMPIGKFEGIEEPLARIAGYTYFMNAARTLTCAAVDAGEKPAVLSAIVKAYLTEGMRKILNDAFDIRAGAAICRGPKNILGRGFIGVPIAITVEGANILTRSLMVFGLGSIRCHPFVQDEMEATETNDLGRLDRAFFGHIGFVFRNAVRALVLALTGGGLAAAPGQGVEARYFKRLTRYSSAFALATDMALATLGGALKRREKISGRMADALAWMYLASSALKRFHDDGHPAGDLPLLKWSCDLALWNIQEALLGVIDNLPNRLAAAVLRALIFPLGARVRPPGDDLGAELAQGLLNGDGMRQRLTPDIYLPRATEDGLGRLEAALSQVVDARDAREAVRTATGQGKLDAAPDDTLIDRAVSLGIINDEEGRRLSEAEAARDAVIQVDSFDLETYMGLKG